MVTTQIIRAQSEQFARDNALSNITFGNMVVISIYKIFGNFLECLQKEKRLLLSMVTTQVIKAESAQLARDDA